MIVCPLPLSLKINELFAPLSGIVYVRDALGAVEDIVTVLVVPRTIWFVVLDKLIVKPDIPPDETANEPEVTVNPAATFNPPDIVWPAELLSNINDALVPTSGIVYIKDVAGAVAEIVVVFVVPKTN